VAQAAAAHKFAAAGRASQARTRAAAIAKTGKPPPVSKKRHQAALKWAAAGRASQARARAHLKPLPKKQPTLGELPCAPAAIAEHLFAATGVAVPDADILALGENMPGGCLWEYLEAAATAGLGGVRLAGFWQCDEDLFIPGLVYGVGMLGGYHAVLSHPRGLVSWGLLLPRLGVPREAWHLEWATA
jgi:hypothetical protein